jgi:hypothetical protein
LLELISLFELNSASRETLLAPRAAAVSCTDLLTVRQYSSVAEKYMYAILPFSAA